MRSGVNSGTFEERIAKLDELIRRFDELRTFFPGTLWDAVTRLKEERAELAQSLGRRNGRQKE